MCDGIDVWQLAAMDEGSRRTSEARLAAEALLSHSITRSSSLNAINYGFVACISNKSKYTYFLFLFTHSEQRQSAFAEKLSKYCV